MAYRHPPENLDTLPASAMLSAADLAGMMGVSLNTVWRWAKAGRLPAPLRIGPNTTRWKAGEVRAALDRLAEAA